MSWASSSFSNLRASRPGPRVKIVQVSSEAKQRPIMMAFTIKSARRTTARALHVPFDLPSCAAADVVAMRATHRNEMVTRNSQSMTRSGAFLKKRGLLRCRVQEKHGRWRERSRLSFLPNFISTDLNSSKAPLETFQTRCQLTRVVDDRDILSRSARICVAVTIVSL